MGTIEVTISPDCLSATLTIAAERDAFPGESEVRAALAAAGVHHGIMEERLRTVLREGRPVSDEPIAVGSPPQSGPDAQLIWHIDVDRDHRPHINENDRADFKQLHLFEHAHAHQLLVEKVPSGDGVDGITVGGDILEAPPPADLTIPSGKNTYTSGDGLKLFAEIDGYVFWEDGCLHIDNIYHIKGDVDYSTGNVNFQGAVVIDGDVRSGFRVEATDTIFISGTVGAASVYSQNGDVTIRCGILGKGRGKVISGGNLHCGFVQDATLGVKGDVVIDHYAINAQIAAGGTVRLTANEGLVRGGVVTAEAGVFAREVGSQQDKYTEINLSDQRVFQSRAGMWDISRKRAGLAMRISALEKKRALLALLREKSGSLSAEKEHDLAFVESELARLKENLVELDQKELTLQKGAPRSDSRREIRVTGTVHRNVKFGIGLLEFYNQRTLDNVTVSRVRDDIVVNAAECEGEPTGVASAPGVTQSR